MDSSTLSPLVPPDFVFHLFITGAAPNSARAVQNFTALCQQYLPGRYELVIVDLYQQPERAKEEQIVAAPTLIRRFPLPERRMIGDLANAEKVVQWLGMGK